MNVTRLLSSLPIVFAAAFATAALAAPVTRLEVPVTYHPNAGVAPNVKEECQIEKMLATRVGTVLGKLNKTGDGTIEVGTDPAGDNVLRLQITHVLGVGGGAWTGPKAITVAADLLQDGKVVRHTKVNRWSVGGVFGAFKSTCTILERSADAISKDMNRWVRDASYKIVEEPAPKDAVVTEGEAKPVGEEVSGEPQPQPAPLSAEPAPKDEEKAPN